jgi:hypothetical protein
MRLERFRVGQNGSSFFVLSKGTRTIPFLPGLLLIGLGITVLLFPRFFLAVIAMVLVLLGSLLCYITYKFMMLRKQLSSMAKNVESSFYGSSFRGDKPDIDISDLDRDKIVYH